LNKNALDILQDYHAILSDGHFAYTSGRHGSQYVNKDAIYPHTDAVSKLCEWMAEGFSKHSIEVVLGPALGGIVLSQWTAFHLSRIQKKDVLAVFAEKLDENKFALKRGYDEIIKGKKVLVVEDILNTGGSAKRLVELVAAASAELVGVSVLCNRGGVTEKELGTEAKLMSLVNLDFKTWDAADCPLCKKGVPLNKTVGKGKIPT